MTSSASLKANVLEILNSAARKVRGELDRHGGNLSEVPSPETIVAALLEAEKAAKQQRLEVPIESLMGSWRLGFITGTRKVRKRAGIVLGKGFFMPRFVPAQISLTPEGDRLTIANQVQVGMVKLRFTGPARSEGKKNLLAFDFTQLQLLVFDRVVYQGQVRSKRSAKPFAEQRIAVLPFFSFFVATETFIAARGRGGGLAIWVRDRK